MTESRTQIREKTTFAIYDTIFYESRGLQFEPTELLAGIFGCEWGEIDIFAQEIFVKALLNKDAIIAAVAAHLVNWDFDRLNRLAQAIFIEACSEHNYARLSDKKVVIDAAVKMAKKYLDSKDYRYINAVLDKVLPADGEE